jgi:hypothetical protein
MAEKSLWERLNESVANRPVAPDPSMEYVLEAEQEAKKGLKPAAELEQILKDNQTLKEWIDSVSIPSESSQAADVVRKRVPELVAYINDLHQRYLHLIFALAVTEYNRGDTDKEKAPPPS